MMDFDFVIIGSGFGGAVSGMRLAQKGYTVCILEEGKRFRDEDFAKTNWNVWRYFWAPIVKCFGIQRLTFFPNIMILSGAGVGGGSLVYANTLLKPTDTFFKAPQWSHLSDWKNELDPHYEIAKNMLGAVPNTVQHDADFVLRDCAREMNKENTFYPTQVGVFFGEPEKTVSDPYFDGAGPDRTGCHHCGACMVGCRYNAKNTLEKNYLYFAEKFGADISAQTRVTDIRPLTDDGYELLVEKSTSWFVKKRRTIRARKVIVAAGVIGTQKLLLRCKMVTKSLPLLSNRLGQEVRTNGESLLGVSELNSKKKDFSKGIAISSGFWPNEDTHIEGVRYPKGSSSLRFLTMPMASDYRHGIRMLKSLWRLVSDPIQGIKWFFNMRWAESTLILLFMQTIESKIHFVLKRRLFAPGSYKLTTMQDESSEYRVPSYFPLANKAAEIIGKQIGAYPQNTVHEVLLGIPSTAHILGGCTMGANAQSGVVDKNHEVFGYKGLYVCDGSVISANLGVNPSLTISALAERFGALWPLSPRITSEEFAKRTIKFRRT
ncbi:MAG: hypothetical protein A2Z20_03155 [Bdellovibrionales bacterium RBG_16_40_8]|nr:MAG: hypothetical protein A2Z20_03155 [Bdellovibrionales bacterium RBG_16_40_8]